MIFFHALACHIPSVPPRGNIGVSRNAVSVSMPSASDMVARDGQLGELSEASQTSKWMEPHGAQVEDLRGMGERTYIAA